MEKNEKALDPDFIEAKTIEAKAMHLTRIIRRNEERKPADKVEHTVTFVTRDKDNLAVLLCGSAHRLEDLLVEVLQQRPEMRQVLENAVRRYGQQSNWKLS